MFRNSLCLKFNTISFVSHKESVQKNSIPNFLIVTSPAGESMEQSFILATGLEMVNVTISQTVWSADLMLVTALVSVIFWIPLQLFLFSLSNLSFLGFQAQYPNCVTDTPFRVGDGYCNIGLNTSQCDWDGGDCIGIQNDFNLMYPYCDVENPSSVGDGKCQFLQIYNVKECGYDGGDCSEWNTIMRKCMFQIKICTNTTFPSTI